MGWVIGLYIMAIVEQKYFMASLVFKKKTSLMLKRAEKFIEVQLW